MTKGERLLRNMTREIYEGETDGVKEAVRARSREVIAERLAAEKAEASCERTTAQYEIAQKEFVPSISHEMGLWHRKTGYSLSLYFGGRTVVSGRGVQVGRHFYYGVTAFC